MLKTAVKEKIEQPWFGTFTPADPNAPAILVPVEPEASLVPEAIAAVPQTGPGGGVSYDGFLYSLIQSGLSGMGDTVITSPTNGQSLIWDNALGKWVNGSPTTGAYLPLVGGTITGTPGTLVVNAPNAATGAILTAQVNNSQRFLVSADSDHILTLADTSTTGPTATLRLFHKSTSGTPTVGFGSSLQFWGEDNSGSAGSRTAVEYATIRTEASSTAAGAVSSDLVMMNKVSGTSTEGLRFKGSDGRAIFAGALQSPALHVGDLVTHPATAHISRAAGAADPSVLTYLRVKSVGDTALTSGPVDVDIDLSTNRTLAASPSTLYGLRITGGSFSAGSAQTVATAATLFIDQAPLAGSNVTITNPYGLIVNNGVVKVTAPGAGPLSGLLFDLPANDSALSGGITGRIPIRIGANTRFIPYYSS